MLQGEMRRYNHHLSIYLTPTSAESRDTLPVTAQRPAATAVDTRTRTRATVVVVDTVDAREDRLATHVVATATCHVCDLSASLRTLANAE